MTRRRAKAAASARERLGVLEWFRPGEDDRLEAVLDDLARLGIGKLRTGVSWADWHTDAGQDWYHRILPRLGERVELLPCLTYTPPSLGIEPKTSSPPREPERYAEWVAQMIELFGDHFEWVELWNEPNNLNDWDWRLDPEWTLFCDMIGRAARLAQAHGKRTALAGMAPTDPNWLRLVGERGLLEPIDAVGIHAFPGTWEFDWPGWEERIAAVREVIAAAGAEAEVWITEVGYSTWNYDEREQLRTFLEALDAPAERIYWYSAHDLHPDLPHQDGFHEDERHYGFGLRRANGTPKLLFKLLAADGPDGIDVHEPLTRPADPRARRRDGRGPILVTGGAGFVGVNLVDRLVAEGRDVVVLDTLSRSGVERNMGWLERTHPDRVDVEIGDVRDRYTLRRLLEHVDGVVHLAGQVAVTTSLEDPELDFETNLRGTFLLLEELRRLGAPPPLLFASTNKVYGDLAGVELGEFDRRYEPVGGLAGVPESQSLDFRSPYGCSKGAADQYVLDWARSFGLPAVVFRMSCTYGPHQRGNEDQGWLAHFLIQARRGRPITLFGDGKQVRDALYVDDLVEAYVRALHAIDRVAGSAFNLGGGPRNSTSLLELVDRIEALHGQRPRLRFGPWREGDQRWYVSSVERLRERLGWTPRVGIDEGLRRLDEWLAAEEREGEENPRTAEGAAKRSAPETPVVGGGPR